MTLSISDVLTTASVAEWETKILSWASMLGLSVTSWQPGGVGRTIITVMANAMNAADQTASGIAAGGWLDTASAVTPEGGPGWLDLCAQYTYDVTRNAATYGTSTVQLTNTGAAVGPLPAGTYHLRAASGNTYTNSGAITIGAGGTTTIAIVCDQPAAVDIGGSTMTAVTAFPGVSVGTLASSAVGAPAESNSALVARCRLKLASLGPKLGTASSFQYFALTPSLSGYPALSSTITRCKVSADPASGNIEVILANSSGSPDPADISAMQLYLETVATPDGETMTVTGATNVSIATDILVWCPPTYQTQVVTDVKAAVAAFIASLNIGGAQTETSSIVGVSYNALEDYVARAVPYIRTQSTTLNNGTASVALAYNEVAVDAGATVTYQGA